MTRLTSTGQHASTARMDSHQIAAEMVGALGPTLVAAMTGSKDRKLPSKWARPDGPTPSTDFLRRLQFGHRTWKRIEGEEGAHVARQWFIGGNPLLGEVTPLTAIREDRLREVSVALDGFLSSAADV
ncbi:hypothetical protein B7R21_02685 [Subtercola boreus]|uniref:Antitoxin Xre/MbcA/ParS-like toxin-binding domain-containing protein n=1 Tax=Subtercola boreus TaxID=120213 RepID=A0A3E0W2T6_9MICO|nr:hypothetical protein [Subtercola boreus]RFA16301.1 hypothetical protein B7R21_02685 [Subtercola boreus]